MMQKDSYEEERSECLLYYGLSWVTMSLSPFIVDLSLILFNVSSVLPLIHFGK